METTMTGYGNKILLGFAAAACAPFVCASSLVIDEYLDTLEKQTALNEQLGCGYSGYRWIKPGTVEVYDQDSKKIISKPYFAQERWAQAQDNDSLIDEITALENRIRECETGKISPGIPAEGKTLNEFIPIGWHELNDEAYQSLFTGLDVKPAFSPIVETLRREFNGDSKDDLIILIGRQTQTRIGFDDFRLLVLLSRDKDRGYQLLYNVKAGLHDLPVNSSDVLMPQFKIVPGNHKASFQIINTIALEHNRSETAITYYFTYVGGTVLLTKYNFSTMYFSYDSNPEQKRYSRTYDLTTNTLRTYDSRNTETPECSDYAAPKDAINCPAPIDTEEQLVIPHDFLLDLSDMTGFGMIDWQTNYGITTK